MYLRQLAGVETSRLATDGRRNAAQLCVHGFVICSRVCVFSLALSPTHTHARSDPGGFLSIWAAMCVCVRERGGGKLPSLSERQAHPSFPSPKYRCRAALSPPFSPFASDAYAQEDAAAAAAFPPNCVLFLPSSSFLYFPISLTAVMFLFVFLAPLRMSGSITATSERPHDQIIMCCLGNQRYLLTRNNIGGLDYYTLKKNTFWSEYTQMLSYFLGQSPFPTCPVPADQFVPTGATHCKFSGT